MTQGIAYDFQHVTGWWTWTSDNATEYPPTSTSGNRVRFYHQTGFTSTTTDRHINEHLVIYQAPRIRIKLIAECYSNAAFKGSAADVRVKRNGIDVQIAKAAAYLTQDGDTIDGTPKRQEVVMDYEGGNFEIIADMFSDTTDAIAGVDIIVETIDAIQYPEGNQNPINPPTNSVYQLHEIIVHYKDGVFGLGDRAASTIGYMTDKITQILDRFGLLNTFKYDGYVVDTSANTITLRFTEYGTNVLPLAAIIAIVALLVVAVGLIFFSHYEYKENQQLKEFTAASNETFSSIGDILNSGMSDEEKIAAIQAILNNAPRNSTPGNTDNGGTSDKIKDYAIAGGALLIGIAAIGLMKK